MYVPSPPHSLPLAVNAATEAWMDPQLSTPAQSHAGILHPEEADPRQAYVNSATPPYTVAAPYYYPGAGMDPSSMQGYGPVQQFHLHPGHNQNLHSPYAYVYHAMTWPVQGQAGPMWGVTPAQQHHARSSQPPPVGGWQGGVYGMPPYGGGGGYGYDAGYGSFPRPPHQPRPLPASGPSSGRGYSTSEGTDQLHLSTQSSGDDGLATFGGMRIHSPVPMSSVHSASRRATGSSLDSSLQTSPDGRQGNSQRSEHVMWCGNVPANASIEELWEFFSQLPPSDSPPVGVSTSIPMEPALDTVGVPALAASPASSEAQAAVTDPLVAQHGVLSIFIISRSNCAFVNYISDRHLQRAVRHFSGLSLRPADPLCPRLVARVRKKIDEVNAGVGGQRGKGMHVAYAKEHDKRRKEDLASARASTPPITPPSISSEADVASDSTNPSISRPQVSLNNSTDAISTASRESATGNGLTPAAATKGGGDSSSGSLGSSQSYSSTNSSLFRHPAFQQRFFILKGAQVQDIEESVRTGLWTTQTHNEAVLDQAYRNSETVTLIFSANGSGSFFGYARMAGPIGSDKTVDTSARMNKLTEDAEGELITQTNADVAVAEDRLSTSMDLTPMGSSTKMKRVASTRRDTMLSPSDMSQGHLASSPLSIQPDNSDAASSWPFPANEPPQVTHLAPQVTHLTHSAQGRERGMFQSPSAPGALTGSAGPSDSSQASVALGSSDQIRYVQAAVINAYSWPGSKNMPTTSAAPPTLPSISKGETLQVDEPSQVDQTESALAGLGSVDAAAAHDLSLWNERSLSELAIRAAIHNFRIDEREASREARVAVDVAGRTPPPSSAFSEATARPSTNAASVALATASDTLGRPFPIEWIKTTPLPFSETKQLRNPWRDNKQIKVSRDGTEVEPVVGNLLLQVWDSFDKSQHDDRAQRSAQHPV